MGIFCKSFYIYMKILYTNHKFIYMYIMLIMDTKYQKRAKVY